MHYYDVIVVGAGPAGLEAAYNLAYNDVNVLVLEEHPTIGIPLQCGEGISAKVMEEFPHIRNTDFIVRKVNTTKLFFPGNKVILGDIHSFMIDRTKFDQYLAQLAIKQGAKIQTSAKVLAAEELKNGVKLLVKGQEAEYYECKYLVIAEGARAKISQMLGFKPPSPLIKAYEYKVEGEWTETLDFYFDNSRYPYGYAWVFPRDSETNIGVVSNGTNVPEMLDRFLKVKGIPKRVIRKIGGRIPMSGAIPKLYSQNSLVIGDAAGIVNPIFYGGIRLGMLSAKIATDAIITALNDNDNKLLLSSYELKLSSYPFMAKYNLIAQRSFYGKGNAFLKTIGSLFDKQYINRIEGFKIIAFGLKFLRYPQLIFRLKTLYYLYKGLKTARDWGF